MLFDKEAAAHLYETSLTPTQRLIGRKDGRVLLEAEVLDTNELRWWLLGVRGNGEVVSPKFCARLSKQVTRHIPHL